MKLNLIILSVLMGALTACSSSPDSQYYILSPSNSAESPSAETKTAADNNWKIVEVKIPELLDRPQIVIKSGKNDITLLEYNRWAEPVESMVASVLEQDLAASAVSTPDAALTEAAAEYVNKHQISITIDEFDADDNAQVTLKASWEDESGGQKRHFNFVHQEPANSSDIDAEIDLMNHLLGELAEAILTGNGK